MKGKRLKNVDDSDGEEYIDEGFEDMGVTDEKDRSSLIREVKRIVKESQSRESGGSRRPRVWE